MATTSPESAGTELTSDQEHQKETILTQDAPSKRGETRDATILKHGDVYFLSDKAGDVPWSLPHAFGLYADDCRFLNGLTLTVNDVPLRALSGSRVGGQHCAHTLTNDQKLPDISGTSIPENALTVRRSREIRARTVDESIRIENHSLDRVHLKIGIAFRCQFEDLFVVKGFSDAERGTVDGPTVTQNHALLWTYYGRDGRTRYVRVRFEPRPVAISGSRAEFEVRLMSGESATLQCAMTPSYDGRGAESVRGGQIPTRRLTQVEDRWLQSVSEVRSSHETFDEIFRRAVLDLRVLRSKLRRRHYFAAGVPWFVTLFGRDTALAALQTLPFGHRMARDTLWLLADYQAESHDKYRDAEPGKILHELRRGELARLGEIPQSPAYYGTVDATMLFLILAAEYLAWTGDLETIRSLRSNIERALGWMSNYGDHDQDGYFDYVGNYRNGLVNQGWKDSGNAIVNADGSLVTPPVALTEVQSYAFKAWRDTAWLLRQLGDVAQPVALERNATILRTRFAHDFWSDELGCYVLARQAGGRPAAVVASNAGQALWGGIAEPSHARQVVDRLLRPDMFTGWGVRTLSAREKRFNPVSYHLGSVWPHDNGLFVAGARRYGADEAALRVFEGLFDAAMHFPGFRLPELFCGYARHAGEPPIPYPHASAPQAWAAGALPHGLWNLLGLRPDALRGRLMVVRPVLPRFIDWLQLNGLRIGEAVVDLRFERHQGETVMSPNVTEGQLHIDIAETFD